MYRKKSIRKWRGVLKIDKFLRCQDNKLIELLILIDLLLWKYLFILEEISIMFKNLITYKNF